MNDLISDRRWLEWARSLRFPDYPDPDAARVYLTSLSRSLENAPLETNGLDRESRLALVAIANIHHLQIGEAVKYETERIEAQAGQSLFRGASKVLGLFGTVKPLAKAGSVAAGAIADEADAGARQRIHEVRRLSRDAEQRVIALMRRLLPA